ncbi:RNA polymerase II transcription elongation factor-domain-containing protein [Xylaria sp. FL1777]|nr:RNA polymerase II transcription elongation factor-domain-containing protein [Xylaria sp. FL1777]
MASLATGTVDPTKVGKYRVVLSDALLGKDPKEIYTGIRYNHKPSLSASTAPHQARIKPTGSTDSSASYDLSFQDDGGRYAYQGTRGHEDNQYVLIFDPENQVFVLHRVDSMFNMNLVRTPTNNDAEDLRQEYPQLKAHQPSRSTKATNKTTSSKPTKPKKPAPKDARPSVVKKAEPAPVHPPKPNKAHHDSEDESSDDDLLTIEDPGGAAPPSNRDFSPGFIDKPRRFSEFVQQQNEEEDEEEDGDFEIEVEAFNNDADGEEEEEEDDEPENFTLPSPIHRQMMSQNINGVGGGGGHNSFGTTIQSAPVEQVSDEDEEDEMEDVDGGGAPISQDDMVDDLEAVLMAELEKEESDVSEEE